MSYGIYKHLDLPIYNLSMNSFFKLYFRCVEYLSEDTENNYTEAQIKDLAKEQWLLNDLKEICPGSLPANLKDEMRTVLNGRFVLQINAVIDIGKY